MPAIPRSIRLGRRTAFSLEAENRRLIVALAEARDQLQSTEAANANLRIEVEAADALLGTALDRLLEAGAPDV